MVSAISPLIDVQKSKNGPHIIPITTQKTDFHTKAERSTYKRLTENSYLTIAPHKAKGIETTRFT